MQSATTTEKSPVATATARSTASKHATLLSWHRWGGIIATAVLLVAALTGLPLVYKKQLVHWLVTPDATLPLQYGVADMPAQLDTIASRTPGIESYLIKAPNAEEPYWTLTAPDGHFRLLAIDTLEPHTRNTWLLDSLVVIRELHVALMAGLFGEYLLLLAGLIGLALGVTGLILWWPARKGFRWRWILPKRFKIQLLMQYHRHSGALSSLLMLLVILTGALMLWQSLVFPLLPALQTTLQEDRVPGNNVAPPSALLARAVKAIPDGWPIYIRLEPETSVRFRLPGEWHPNGRTSVTINRGSGEVRVTTRSDEVSPPRALVNQFYPLHSGYGMNAVYLLLVFISGIALAWLGLTGIVSWFRRS